jgi:hypothetical protein
MRTSPSTTELPLSRPYPKGKDKMSITNHHRLIAKILVSTAIGFGALIVAAAPASANTNAASPDPNPFSTLSCSCQKTAPAGGPASTAEIDRGIRNGLAAALPGLPAPAQPGQPRP